MKRFNPQERQDKFKRQGSEREQSIKVSSTSKSENAKEKRQPNVCNYGNYHGYYTSRRPQGDAKIDSRLDLIDESKFTKKRILDIGCNSGNITIAIARKYNIISIHGVDIDESLIAKANTNLKIAYSLSDPKEDSANTTIDLALKTHYFPLSMSNMFGFMPMAIPPNKKKEFTNFPFNVSFQTEDWTETKTNKYNQYDTILALSITKWIQLHGGDKGLKSFFKKVYESLEVGGAFILEPQDFDTFQKRAKYIDPSKDVKEEHQFLPEDYTDFLINKIGFKEYHDLGIPKTTAKDRFTFTLNESTLTESPCFVLNIE